MAIQFFLNGYVKINSSDTPISDVKVEIWEINEPYGWLSSNITNKAGYFSCFINENIATLLETPETVQLKYYIKKNGTVLAEGLLTPPFTSPVEIVVTAAVYDAIVTVDFVPESQSISVISVSGTVTDINNSACSNIVINLSEVGFRSKTFITSASTNEKGQYNIVLNSKFLGNELNANRSIVIEAVDGETILGTSPTIFDLSKDVKADLVLDNLDSSYEFEKFVGQIQYIIGSADIGSLVVSVESGVDEIKYISGATGIDEKTIAAVANAYKFAVDTELPEDILYSLLKFTGTLSNPLESLSPSTLREIVENAVLGNIISAYNETEISEHVATAKRFKVEQVKSKLIIGESYSINSLLNAVFEGHVAALDLQDAIDDYLSLYLEEYPTQEAFWDAYLDFTEDENLVKQIKSSLKIGSISNYQPLIIKKIKENLSSDHISTLAKWSVLEWIALIDNVCTATSSLYVPAAIRGLETFPHNTDVQEIYARRLAAISQALYPLANICHNLEGSSGEDIISDETTRDLIITFIGNNPNFDVRSSSIYDINANDHNLTDIPDLGVLQSAMEGIARLSRITGGNPYAIIELIKAGYSSATEFALMGWENFNESYGYLFSHNETRLAGPCAYQEIPGLVPDAAGVFERAVSISNGLAMALGGALVDFTNPYPEVITGANDSNVVNSKDVPVNQMGIGYPHAVSKFTPSPNNFAFVNSGNGLNSPAPPSSSSSVVNSSPTLASLFGSLDYTFCNDCKSIYSPSAYLVDTLNFIKNSNSFVYNELNSRRPDIKFIDLTCDNTNTPVPYIDIVNEILEVKVLTASAYTPPVNVSFATKTIAKISKLSKSDISVVSQTNFVASVNINQPILIGNKTVGQNISIAPNNNVQAAVNAQQTSSPAPSKSTNEQNGVSMSIPAAKISSQAAYPEKIFRDTTTNAYVDFTSFKPDGGTITTHQIIYEQKLKAAVYPNTLPFILAIEESRVYLKHFNTSRLDLMRLFKPANQSTASTPPSNSITDFSICSEFLGISQTAASIIAGNHPLYSSGQTFTLYGAASATSPLFRDPITGAIDTTTGGSDRWEDAMSARIDILLQQVNINYNELLQLLVTSYVNPYLSGSTIYRKIGIKPTTSSVSNNTALMNEMRLVFNTSLSPLVSATTSASSSTISTVFYKKLASIVKLYRTGKLSIYHWDILLRSMALPATSGVVDPINADAFKQIGRILQISDELKLPIDVLSMWWNDPDAEEYMNYPQNSTNKLTSVYQDIFNDKSVINNASSNIFSDPSNISLHQYLNNTGQLANVCGIRENEVIALLEFIGIPSLATNISLSVLSRLYVVSQLAFVWQYSIGELITIMKLANITIPRPNITTSIGTSSSSLNTYLDILTAIISNVKAVSISGFKVAEINYLVADANGNNASAPPPSKVQAFFEAIKKELQRQPIFVDNRLSSDLELRAISWNEFFRLRSIIIQRFSTEFGVSSKDAQRILEVTISGTGDGVFAVILNENFLNGTYGLTESNLRYVDDFPNEHLSGGKLPSSYSISGTWYYPPFELVGNYKPSVSLSKLYHTYRYFHKVALVYQRLGLREKEFSLVFEDNTYYSINFGFYSLPAFYDSGNVLKNVAGDTTITATTSTFLYNGLLRVCRVMDLINKLRLPEDALEKMLNTLRGVNINIVSNNPVEFSSSVEDLNTAYNNFLNILKRPEWGSMLEELLGNYSAGSGTTTKYGSSGPNSLLSVKFAFGPAAPDFNFRDYDNISMFIKAIEIIEHCLKIGLQPSSVHKLIVENISNSDSRALVLAANAKYDPKDWEGVSKTLRDPLRSMQRDAMIAFLRKKPNDLFAELLLDVEMDPCMMTSRTKQAISSVQLFVDRVIMGLEKTTGGSLLSIPTSNLNQWQGWRKWYRIWEANRKIFFYPEDWMEPELRDDKTPFFLELENELKQDVITLENAEKAISNYLLRLDEVSKLEPVGNCDQITADGTIITHIIARTHGASNVYYHRKLIKNSFTPWEKMGVTPEGSHIVPFVWNNRLMLFWLSFAEKAAPFTRSMHFMKNMLISNPLHSVGDGDSAEWFQNDMTDNESDRFASSTDPMANHYKKMEISLSWSEYKNGEWRDLKRGKDSIVLNINPFLERMINRTGNVTEKNLLKMLTNNGNIDIFNLIKSRIFLYPYVHGTTDIIPPSVGSSYAIASGDLYLMVNFPTYRGLSISGGGHKEYADFVKAFHFSCNTNNMEVLRDTLFKKRVVPPSGTFFQNQALVSYEPGNDLKIDTVANATDQMFFYDKPSSPKRVSVVLQNGTPTANKIITARASNFKIIPQAGYNWFSLDNPFFFEDAQNVFLVTKKYFSPTLLSSTFATGNPAANLSSSYSSLDSIGSGGLSKGSYFAPESFQADVLAPGGSYVTKFYFRTFYHHHTHLFRRMINRYGALGLYRPDRLNSTTPPVVQAARVSDDTIIFGTQYQPNSSLTATPHPTNKIDYSPDGAYSVYNWEIFYHMPMLIAQRLSDNLQFFEAQKWYHFVFDPTSSSFLNNDAPANANQKYWKFYEFYRLAGVGGTSLSSLLDQIRTATPSAMAQVEASNASPFQPFFIGRLRPLAFMKNVVMKYLDNLIAWGDNLFSRDTLESINEATQIYILASNVLGPRPTKSIQRATTKPYSYHTLTTTTGVTLDLISQASVKIESFIDPAMGNTLTGANAPFGSMGYFCVMPNEKLLKYWDIVEDRLYKIRHCQNIQGIVQNRSLFDTAIDPAMLVSAAAAGVDMGSVLNSVAGLDTPNYKFSYLVQKANEFVADVKALGSALQSAIEKKDAEEVAALRQSQEVNIQNIVLLVKKRQVDEAKANYDALVKSRNNAVARGNYYSNLIKSKLNSEEQLQLEHMRGSIDLQKDVAMLRGVAQAMSLIPRFHGQFIGGVGASFGGQEIGASLNIIADVKASQQSILGIKANISSTRAGHLRREQDWKFQMENAKAETEQIEKQLVAADLRIKVSEQEYENQKIQIENSANVYEFMKYKYTNVQLYDWMIKQVFDTYNGAYRIALNMAQKAFNSYKWELPHSDAVNAVLIQNSYWNSRKQGFLAGEMLQLDIRNMETQYILDNKRVFELTKHVSLMQLDPYQLVRLRMSGYCEIEIPEEWFDLDFPGHINRTIKSVSISIPCVSGPYSSIPVTLSLKGKTKRRKDTTGAPLEVGNPPCIRAAFSVSQNDSGTFEANMRDERYLPFEGAGAISTWSVSLFNSKETTSGFTPPELASFDPDSISDVILHIKYTAQDSGSDTFNDTRRTAVQSFLETSSEFSLSRVFSLKHEFPTEWFAYENAIAASVTGSLDFQLKIEHFPIMCANKTVKISGIKMCARYNDVEDVTTFALTGNTSPSTGPGAGLGGVTLVSVTDISGTNISSIRKDPGTTDLSGSSVNIDKDLNRNFSLNYTGASTTLMNKLKDVYFIVLYKLV